MTFTLDRFLFRFLVADECSRALLGFEQAAEFELAIGAHHGVGIDGEIDGKLADRRQLIAGRQGAGGDTRPDLIDELAIDRDAAMKIEAEVEAAVFGILNHESLMYYITSTLCQEFFGGARTGNAEVPRFTAENKRATCNYNVYAIPLAVDDASV